jgi:hypothetical protein
VIHSVVPSAYSAVLTYEVENSFGNANNTFIIQFSTDPYYSFVSNESTTSSAYPELARQRMGGEGEREIICLHSLSTSPLAVDSFIDLIRKDSLQQQIITFELKSLTHYIAEITRLVISLLFQVYQI